MIRTTIEVDGMMCGMCETHINEAVRRNFKVKKVTSSRSKGETMILSEEPLDTDELKKVISDTGYTAGDVQTEEYKKKGLFH
ncbi:MAG: heavy-metal-associated domain-containing protein [Eubacterium sp.]|nr:heavy-metal-associated domain-containing protein [Eubacterium sp.]MBQ9322320.1 heavy-metal-associated domain-containing protein [Eubacterium sp.]